MRTLRAKITALTLAAILVSVFAVGLISIFSIQRTAEEISTQYMNELCLEKANEMNYFLSEIEQDVNIAVHYLTDAIDVVPLAEGGVIGAVGTGDSLEGHDYDSQQQKKLDAYLHDHVTQARFLFHSIAYNSMNALTYYYYINPEITKTEPGFLFVRPGLADYQEYPTIDILAFSSDDIANVGWYYETLDRGRPSWINPYYDAGLDKTVTSYIAPIYKAGTFVGMTGMDVSYDSLVEKVRNLDIYQTGYAFLTDEYGKIIYHPTLDAGTMLSEVNTELKANKDYLTANEDSSALINYSFNGVKKRAAWRTLSNGLRLFVSAPVLEIEAVWQALIVQIVVTAVALIALFAILTTVIIRRVTDPLKKLTEASEQITEGNYDVELPSEGRDEVGTLTRSFRHLTEHLKSYVSDLNSKAYKDGLTSVKNKAAMNIYVEQINELPLTERKYAVLLFDCNNLKDINDDYGHDKGDIYLRTACSVVCRSFPRSPVFRMGGDEFVAILQGEAYEEKENLILQYRESVNAVNQKAKKPWERANLAMGSAVYDMLNDNEFADVLKRADEEMYEEKRIMKQEQAGEDLSEGFTD